ncbi:MAG: HTH domain-containing protein [Deferribacterales bacterium]
MRQREFTPDERQSLESNPNVLKVGNSNITYTADFRQHALNCYYDGEPPRKIFKQAGIDISIFPEGYPESTISRWHNAEKKPHKSSRKSGSGRPKKTSNMTTEEMEARIAYLEAENDFLKKLRALERGE